MDNPRTPRSTLPGALWWPLAALVVLALAAWVLLSDGGNAAVTPADLAAGERLYASHCASCHGANLEGQPEWRRRKADGKLPAPPHDDSGHTWHHDDELLLAIVKHGLVPPHGPPDYPSDMPAFAGTLGDVEIRNVLAFIASRWSQETRKLRAERLGS
ncbi:MAG TPA: cytochrome c [Gammaproteobacteria bacterium]